MLSVPDTNDVKVLLVEAVYGFERDDTDGYRLAKQCVRAALKALGYERYVAQHHVDENPQTQWSVVDTRYTTNVWYCQHESQAIWLCRTLNEDDERSFCAEN